MFCGLLPSDHLYDLLHARGAEEVVCGGVADLVGDGAMSGDHQVRGRHYTTVNDTALRSLHVCCGGNAGGRRERERETFGSKEEFDIHAHVLYNNYLIIIMRS